MTGDQPADTMHSAARGITQAIWQEGIDELPATYVVMENGLPQDFSLPSLPSGAKASMAPTDRIGYMRIESTPDGLQASVGCLDPSTQTHYSEPFKL